MRIDYDPDKNQRNIEQRNLDFEQARHLDWDNALIWQDLRFDYGEVRLNMLAPLNDRLHYLTFKPIEGGVRVISFRKANTREIKQYENRQ